jgi:hypothetical protein
MRNLDQLDRTMPLAFYACVNETLTDPEMVELAERMNMPLLLSCDIPLEGVQVLIEDPAIVDQMLTWLQANQKWRSSLESTLQCLAEHDGRPLLTAFMPMSEFLALGEDLMADKQFAGLEFPFAQWQAMGATRGYIDGYRLV